MTSMLKNRVVPILAALTLLAATTNALAGKKTDGVLPDRLYTLNGAVNSGLTVTLPNMQATGNDPLFAVPFFVPKGYRPNSPINFTLKYSSSGGVDCGNYVVDSLGALRFQTGRPVNETVPGTGGTFEPEDGSTLVPSNGFDLGEKTWVLSPDADLPVAQGDVLQAVFSRVPLASSDTCTDLLTVVGVQVDYVTK